MGTQTKSTQGGDSIRDVKAADEGNPLPHADHYLILTVHELKKILRTKGGYLYENMATGRADNT